MNRLPTIRIAQGEPFASSFTLTGQDWTGYTGVVTYKKAPQGKLILETDATGDALGEVAFSLTAAETALFPAFPVIGDRKVGVYQVRMTQASPEDVQTFQGDLHVASAV
jgi:hypothetical protein